MKPARTEFSNDVVRLADLTVNTDLLEGLQFENCNILGPAVLAPLGQTSITHCSFDGEGFDDFAWIVARGRTRVVGAIGALNCTFFRCRMTQIGLAIPEDEAERVRQSFEG